MLASFLQYPHIPITNGQTEESSIPFGYFFNSAPEANFGPDTLACLDQLHSDMMNAPDRPDLQKCDAPAILTYFGQFLCHDISGLTESDMAPPLPGISGQFEPQSRAAVVARLCNARSGGLDLDCLYGKEGDTGNAALNKLNGLLRYPKDRAMMWIGTYGDLDRRVRFPEHDKGGDLLRLERLIASGAFTEADVDALPQAHRVLFRLSDGSLNLSRAIIGDSRNDDSLMLAQLHLAFLRFHNRMVQAWPKPRTAGDENEVFNWARAQVRRVYQWLVLHVWLPSLCDPAVVTQILAAGPVLYDHFLQNHGLPEGGLLPMPLEFSMACMRIGQSTERPRYDWNQNYGQADKALSNSAGLDQLFALTSTGVQPSAPLDPHHPMFGKSARLPGRWGADWDRLVHPAPAHPNRCMSPINTELSDSQARMGLKADPSAVHTSLAGHLRRGALLNLPSAQAVQAGLASLGLAVSPLTTDQLPSGATGASVMRGGFEHETPLWFYTLKEAEVMGRGQHLGPLASHIIAGTLIGLIWRGDAPVLDVVGSDNGRWHPADGPRVSGQVVDSFPALMRAALLMENPDFSADLT
jgi:hypothetical protein